MQALIINFACEIFSCIKTLGLSFVYKNMQECYLSYEKNVINSSLSYGENWFSSQMIKIKPFIVVLTSISDENK